MTTNYHTAIPTNSAANASTFNVPLGQLDNAISQILDGSNTFSKLVFSAASTLVISSGSITPTNNVHLVQSESGSTDNLDTITAVNNSFLFLKAVGGHTITLTGSGNIVGQSIVLTGNAIIGLFCHNNQWSVIGKSIGVRSGFEYIWQEPGANFYSPPIPSTVDQAIERLANRTNAVYPAGSIVGLECDVDDDTIVTVRSGWAVGRFSAGLMRLGSDSSVDLSVSGIGGLDTGSLTSDTTYYIYICIGTSGTGLIASTNAVTPTLPTGYNTYYRRIGAVRYFTASLLRQKTITNGTYREVIYNGTNASPFLLLNEVNIGDIASPTIVDFSGLVPVSAEWALVTISTNTPSAQAQVYWLANGRSRFLYDAYTNTFQNTWNGKVELEGVIGTIYGSAADEDVYLYANGYIDNMLTDVSF